ncbi:MAG: valine--tRNA ligase [Chloroflexota bacterium]|nr:MAG: valine--tRNA ligase [Chloroflexota bacterium]
MTSETDARPDMAPAYRPAEVEERCYAWWEETGLFRPDPNSTRPTFCITIPPPNVTGDLHMGHALTYGIEDVLGRYKRMRGFKTLILPGTDHAGIATQNVVEKQLAAEGLSRDDLGRERFLERVWEWKDQYADNIRRQFRAMGCGFDWSRERFTMDPAYVDAVLEFFIRLYREGKIYRGWRVINWCVRCHSAISDIEVEDEQRDDTLYYLRYPFVAGDGDIVVATVRPETILGDVAVAVHPDDARYSAFVDKEVSLPLLDRPLTIIADSMVDMAFGTGAVKITPAHDFADFEVGERHGLPMPIAIDPQARITEVGGPYRGQSVAEARESVLRDLQEGGFLVKTEPLRHLVPTCERCGALLEPLLSEQWFMKMDELAQPAIDVVHDRRVTFIPQRWSRVYLDWMERIRPWTLSRQLWWGHRIPIYYCANGHAVASKSWPDACTDCGAAIERQDPDVLDTWFSSALWPFAALGWPQWTEDLETFYPTSFMNTSSQILYLWIARMIMTGLKFMDDIPFPVVLINPTILNHLGQRMSKSLGTGIDPLNLVRIYGADALRFGLITSGSTHQQDIRFSADRVEQARNFANKIWNVARFIVSNQVDDEAGNLDFRPEDRWILSRLSAVTQAATRDFERCELSGAGQRLFDFAWAELADWYLEVAKLRLFDGSDIVGGFTARAVLWSVLDNTVRLLHPYMPFLTEEIWGFLRETGSPAARELSGWHQDLPKSIMAAPWPDAGSRDEAVERDMGVVRDIVREVRAARAQYGVEPGKYIPASVVTADDDGSVEASAALISRMGRLRPLDLAPAMPERRPNIVSILVGSVTVLLPLAEMTDVRAERDRLGKDLEDVAGALQKVRAKLSNSAFTERAPSHVVERERVRADTLEERARRLREQVDALAV